MANLRKTLTENPGVVDALNNFSLHLQSSVATVLGERNESAVNPNTLPSVRIGAVQSGKVQDIKSQDLLSYTLQPTPFGTDIVAIEISPNFVVKMAVELKHDHKMQDWLKENKIRGREKAIYLLSSSGMQLMGNAMLAPDSQIPHEEVDKIIKKSVSLASKQLLADLDS